MNGYDNSVADVLKSAIHDAQELIRGEMTLARAELRDEVSRMGSAVAALAAAAVAGLMAVVLLLTAVAWAIAEVLAWPVWTGFALVTAVVLLAALLLAYVGRARLNGGRHMPRTVDTLRENMQWMRARTP